MGLQDIKTPEARLAGVVGQIVVENAKLGYEIEVTRLQVQEANERTNEMSVQLAQVRRELEHANAEIADLKAQIVAARKADPSVTLVD